ncbi:MAG: glycosyltransferase [Candidatus Sumerlaeota bacterium]|nr:glycosyltransferase [Candidatus Sumerlaeota bacterium]
MNTHPKSLKILSCCPQGYYSQSAGKSYEYVSFVEVPRGMGHCAHHYDYRLAAEAGREAMNDFFLSVVKNGGYDLVMVMTNTDQFLPEVLDEARRHTILMAWNCDDYWRWKDYSSRWAPHFSFMVTTSRSVYEENCSAYPNLLLSQWGCTGMRDGLNTPKDLDISFVGLAYGERLAQVQRLQREFGMSAYGRYVTPPPTFKRRIQLALAKRLGITWSDESLELPDQDAVKAVWNRSRICFTPLEDIHGSVRQIKARVFDMGLSGAVMLCSKNPGLHEFYEPGKEFVEFETMDECAEKARHLLSHEAERAAIARAYYDRTRSEHLWTARFNALFKAMGLGV